MYSFKYEIVFIFYILILRNYRYKKISALHVIVWFL